MRKRPKWRHGSPASSARKPRGSRASIAAKNSASQFPRRSHPGVRDTLPFHARPTPLASRTRAPARLPVRPTHGSPTPGMAPRYREVGMPPRAALARSTRRGRCAVTFPGHGRPPHSASWRIVQFRCRAAAAAPVPSGVGTPRSRDVESHVPLLELRHDDQGCAEAIRPQFARAKVQHEPLCRDPGSLLFAMAFMNPYRHAFRYPASRIEELSSTENRF